MSEATMIQDVRQAKQIVDRMYPTWAELYSRLAAVQIDYAARSGEFASLPRTISMEAKAQIDSASTEPTAELLKELRSMRSA